MKDKLMKILILMVICSCCFAGAAKATGQFAERIIIGQDTLGMLACPIDADTVLRRKVSQRIERAGIVTGLWRKYIGTWRLEEGQLYLEKLETWDKDIIDLGGIFDAYRENGRIAARWFSGDIRVVRGECVYYKHMGFDRHYEHETIYTLRRGRVVSNKEKRNSLREGSNAESWVTLQMLFNGDDMEWEGDSSLSVKLWPGLDGSVDRIKVTSSYSSLKSGQDTVPVWERKYKEKNRRYGHRHPYTREVMECVQLMTDWEVLVLDGKIQPHVFEVTWRKNIPRPEYMNWQLKLWLCPDSLDMDGCGYRVKDVSLLQADPRLMTCLRPCLKGAFALKHPRGYRARWQIADGWLWLTGIRNARTGEMIPLSVLAPGNNGEPIEASWYTGKFKIGLGGVVDDGNYRYDAECCDMECEVVQGRVKRLNRDL